MKRLVVTLVVFLAAGAVAGAHGGSMGTMGGSGGVVLADDGSLLITQMSMGGGHMGGDTTISRELVNISPDGTERWRVSFDDGWPMMAASNGDLVVLPVVDSWWMGNDGSGDGGWDHGHNGGGHPLTDDEGLGHGYLVGLSLATGEELWRVELDGDMASQPQFSEDGSRFYTSVHEMAGGHSGGGPIMQGDAAGSGVLMGTTLVAIDREGDVLWTLDLSSDHMGGPHMMGGGS